MSYIARQLRPQSSYKPSAHNETPPERHEKQGEIDELMTVREVAKIVRVDDTTVRRWVKQGALEAIALPHRGKRQAYRIKRSTLGKILDGGADLG